MGLKQWIDELDEDVLFLDSGLNKAIVVYRKKYNLSTPDETLENANWDVVEFQTLLQQAQTSQSSL